MNPIFDPYLNLSPLLVSYLHLLITCHCRIRHHGYYPAWLPCTGGSKVKAREPSTACVRPSTMRPITWRQVRQQLNPTVNFFKLNNGIVKLTCYLYFPPFVLNQDVPLISLANIFQNARLWEDALTVARMAVEIAPHFVVNHFTLANVYITMVAAPISFTPTVFLNFLKTLMCFVALFKQLLLISQLVTKSHPPHLWCHFFLFLDTRRSLRKPCAGTSPLWSCSQSLRLPKID